MSILNRIYRAKNTSMFIVSIAVSLLVFAVLLWINHLNPWQLYATMWEASFGSVSGFSQVIAKTTPFILTAIAAALPARVGLVNVGGEGQLFIGALFSTWAAVSFLGNDSPWLGIPVALLFGALGGAAWSGIAALLQRYMKINETLSTLLLNYVATFVIGYCLNGPLRDPGSTMWPVSPAIPAPVLLPSILHSAYNIGIMISLALALLTWFVVEKTAFGFKLRIVGGNLIAARLGGIPTRRIQFWTLVIAGALAGIAGMLVVTGDDGQLYMSTGVNYGYFGFLASWIAWNRILWAVPAALLIAGITIAGNELQISSNLPSASVQVLMSLLLIGILAVERRAKHERNY